MIVDLSQPHDLNFFALGTFSPLNIFSAPTALPLPGQPYLGPNALFHNLQEEPNKRIVEKAENKRMFRVVFITGLIGLN